jgi:hypothetical protein
MALAVICRSPCAQRPCYRGAQTSDVCAPLCPLVLASVPSDSRDCPSSNICKETSKTIQQISKISGAKATTKPGVKEAEIYYESLNESKKQGV